MNECLKPEGCTAPQEDYSLPCLQNPPTKKALAGLLPEELAQLPGVQPAFRGMQLFKWIASGVTSFSEMQNLPKNLRQQLEQDYCIRSSFVSKKLVDPDGTVKLQLTLHDGKCVETVLLTDKDGRKTACVSCQVGCGMACAFCQTGRLGFSRNLEAAEIVEQFQFLEETVGKLDNIVFMGMGEPMLNLPAIRKAVAVAMTFISICFTSTVLLMAVSDVSALDVIYEVVSATATVGLSRNFTSSLNVIGKLIIIATMYLGRVGPISLAVAIGSKIESQNVISEPTEEISIG